MYFWFRRVQALHLPTIRCFMLTRPKKVFHLQRGWLFLHDWDLGGWTQYSVSKYDWSQNLLNNENNESGKIPMTINSVFWVVVTAAKANSAVMITPGTRPCRRLRQRNFKYFRRKGELLLYQAWCHGAMVSWCCGQHVNMLKHVKTC